MSATYQPGGQDAQGTSQITTANGATYVVVGTPAETLAAINTPAVAPAQAGEDLTIAFTLASGSTVTVDTTQVVSVS